MRLVLACDAGGLIQAGDSVYCMGPYVARCNKSGCDCGMIALNDAAFKDFPLQPINVISWIEMLQDADVVDEAGQAVG